MAYSKYGVDSEVPWTSKPRIDIDGCTVPIVIRSLNKGRTLQEVNNQDMRRLLSEILDKRDRAYFDRSGCLVVHVAGRSAFGRLMALTFVSGLFVKAEVPRSFNRYTGKIMGVPLKFHERRLLEILAPFGVIYLRRQWAESQNSDGSMSITPTGIVELHFWPECPMPKKLEIDRKPYDVHPILPSPEMGSQCQKFDHKAEVCPTSANIRDRPAAGVGSCVKRVLPDE